MTSLAWWNRWAPRVTRFKPGDRVWGSNQGLLGRQGTFAEYCAVEECWLYPTPAGVEDQTAAALALVGITAHLGLFREGQLKSGQTVFVRGGTGGVGSVVIQMAKAVGARVMTTGGSDVKVTRCRELGADVAVNYRTQNVAQAVQAFAPEGVNLFWETLREPDFDEIVGCLAERGRIILMAGREARPGFPVGPFYVKGCSLHGFVMFKATPDEQRACAEDMNRWMQLPANCWQISRTCCHFAKPPPRTDCRRRARFTSQGAGRENRGRSLRRPDANGKRCAPPSRRGKRSREIGHTPATNRRISNKEPQNAERRGT